MFTKFVNPSAWLLILFSLLSCTSSDPNQTKLAFGDILTLIYDAKSSRLKDQGDFQAVSGQMSLYFSGQEDKGVLKITYNAFYEPALCPYSTTCRCYGTSVATYQKFEEPDPATPTLTPYDPSAPPPATPPALDDNVLTVNFNLVVDKTNTNLSSNCPNPLNRSIKVYLYPDKSLDLIDSGHEYRLWPKTY